MRDKTNCLSDRLTSSDQLIGTLVINNIDCKTEVEI